MTDQDTWRQPAAEEDDELRRVAALTYPSQQGRLSCDSQYESETVWLLHVRVFMRQDREAIAELAALFDDVAVRLARRRGRRQSQADLIQVAREGLLVALHRFDPWRRRPFLPFARPTIDGMLLRHLRDRTYAMRPSRRSYELCGSVSAATEALTADLQRMPTSGEIADYLGTSVADVVEARMGARRRNPESLEAPDSTALRDARDDESFTSALVERLALRRGIDRLSDEQRALLRAYFFEECTQAEIAQSLGTTQMTVSRSLRRTIERLRVYLGEDDVKIA